MCARAHLLQLVSDGRKIVRRGVLQGVAGYGGAVVIVHRCPRHPQALAVVLVRVHAHLRGQPRRRLWSERVATPEHRDWRSVLRRADPHGIARRYPNEIRSARGQIPAVLVGADDGLG